MTYYPLDRDAVRTDSSGFRGSTELSPRYSLPQYPVVLLNSDDKKLMFVVHTIMELTRFCQTEATHKMWQAYYEGRSILFFTHKERAELFSELFAARGLQVVIGLI